MMGLFQKATPVSKLRQDLTRAANSRLKLAAKLPQAEELLAAAIAERRGHLTVESLDDAAVPRDKVDVAQGCLDDIRYLLDEVNAKIAGLERDLAAAEDREVRDAAAAKLRTHVDARAH
jgi:hypothetical protein